VTRVVLVRANSVNALGLSYFLGLGSSLPFIMDSLLTGLVHHTVLGLSRVLGDACLSVFRYLACPDSSIEGGPSSLPGGP
jgi:hypothetical protein